MHILSWRYIYQICVSLPPEVENYVFKYSQW